MAEEHPRVKRRKFTAPISPSPISHEDHLNDKSSSDPPSTLLVRSPSCENNGNSVTYYNSGKIDGNGVSPEGLDRLTRRDLPLSSGNFALQAYQLQVMMLEQENKKRLLKARQEQDPASSCTNHTDQGGEDGTQQDGPRDYRRQRTSLVQQNWERQLMLLEQQNMKRLLMARKEQDCTNSCINHTNLDGEDGTRQGGNVSNDTSFPTDARAAVTANSGEGDSWARNSKRLEGNDNFPLTRHEAAQDERFLSGAQMDSNAVAGARRQSFFDVTLAAPAPPLLGIRRPSPSTMQVEERGKVYEENTSSPQLPQSQALLAATSDPHCRSSSDSTVVEIDRPLTDARHNPEASLQAAIESSTGEGTQAAHFRNNPRTRVFVNDGTSDTQREGTHSQLESMVIPRDEGPKVLDDLVGNTRDNISQLSQRLPLWLQNIRDLRDSLSKGEEALRADQEQLDIRQTEINTLEARYEDIMRLAPHSQLETLHRYREESKSTMQLDVKELHRRREERLTGILEKRARIEDLEGWTTDFESSTKGIMDDLKALLAQLHNG